MRRGGFALRATTTVLAGVALAFGGVLVAVAPAHAADFPDVDTELELNAAIDYAVDNPGDPVVVSIVDDFTLLTGISPLTAGSVTINGDGHTISGDAVATFESTGSSTLALTNLALDFTNVSAAIEASGDPGVPATSPTVSLTGVDITVDVFATGVLTTDSAFSANDLMVTGGSFGIAISASFGEVSLSDVSSVNADSCGIQVGLEGDSVLAATRLTVTGADCTGLELVALDTAAATISDSVFAGNGGAVELFNTGTGTITMTGSTLMGSTTGPQLDARSMVGDIMVSNSTISGALDTGTGLAPVYVLPLDGDITFSHSTITGNTVSTTPVVEVGGCGCGAGVGVTTFDHTIIGGNPGTSATAPDLFADSGEILAVNWSLIGSVDPLDTTTLDAIATGSGNLFDPSVAIAPELGALAMNGGVTPTHLPNGTSPVINAGDATFAPPPATDQRGAARISGGIIDIGAVEVQFNPTLVLSRTTTAVGDQVTLTGTGLPADTTFTMVFNSTPVTLGTAASNASGGLAFAFTVPTSVPAGAHTVTATLAGNVVGSAAITVTGLPDTGVDTTSTTLFAALLLLVGTGAVLLRRRRA